MAHDMAVKKSANLPVSVRVLEKTPITYTLSKRKPTLGTVTNMG